jgi:hypothetical protein
VKKLFYTIYYCYNILSLLEGRRYVTQYTITIYAVGVPFLSMNTNLTICMDQEKNYF